MNVRMPDGSARCADHTYTVDYQGYTDERCSECFYGDEDVAPEAKGKSLKLLTHSVAVLAGAFAGTLLTFSLWVVDPTTAFNDGFKDGACAIEYVEAGENVWEDGFGHPCFGE